MTLKFLPDLYRNHQALTRRTRTALRETAAHILKPSTGRGRAICGCGQPAVGVSAVSIWLKKDGTAKTRGTLRCRSPWLCGECAPAKAAQRLDRLLNLAQALEIQQGRMASVTITIRHTRDAKLVDLKQAIETASRKARQGSPWNRQKLKHDVIGVLSAPEVTYSFKHGWHYHIHHSFLTGHEGNPAELGAWFIDRYMAYLDKAGFSADIRGQEVSEIRDPVAYIRYVLKGNGASKQNTQLVSNDTEKTSLNPFHILQNALSSKQMKALWHEFAAAMPGTRSCVISKSIADRLNIPRDQDDVGVDHGQQVGQLPSDVWRYLVNHRKSNVVLSLVEDRGLSSWPEIRELALSLSTPIPTPIPNPDNKATLIKGESEKINKLLDHLYHEPSARDIANAALAVRWQLSGKERNGASIRAAYDQARLYAVSKGLLFIPPTMKDVLESYANNGE